MSDPRRLLDGGGTDIERSLLEAGDAEAPDGGAKRRAAIALAIGVTSVWPTAAAASATATATAKTAKVGVPLIVKLLAVGTVGVGTLGVAQFVVSKPEPAPVTETATATNPVPAVDKGRTQAAPEMKVAEAPPVEAPRAAAAVEPERRAPSASAAAPKSSADSSIASEILMIDQARRSLAAGSGPTAIRALDDYRRQYPRGRFSEEATLLRIEALAQSGNRAGAKSLAGRYRASHPNSPHLRRIESLVGSP